MIPRPTPATVPNRYVLLAAIDATDAADRVVDAAVDEASTLPNAEIHLVHVLPSLHVDPMIAAPILEQARGLLEHQAAAARERCEAPVRTHLMLGDPWRQTVQLAALLQADQLFVGTSRHGVLTRWLVGSVAERIVRNGSCPVLVVRPKEYPQDPEIEPPCPACLEVQRDSLGTRLWCEVHGRRYPHAHLHYESPNSFGLGSMLIRP